MPNLQPSPDSPLRPAEVIALISSMLLVGTSFGAVAPLVSALLEQRGFSEYFTGGVSAMLAVAIALLSTRVGRLVERHGTQRINFLGLVGQAPSASPDWEWHWHSTNRRCFSSALRWVPPPP